MIKMFKLKYVYVILIFLVYLLYNNYPQKKTNEKIFSDQRHSKQFKIMIWTTLWSKKWEIVDLSDIKCEYSNCILTSDRNELNNSDAVLFHLRDINKSDVPLYHFANQSYVLFNWEPPYYSPLENIYPIVSDTNWVMSYRRDSDIFVPYGQIVKCNNSKWKLSKSAFKKKTRKIAWMVSNCNTTSKRELYVRALKKHIDVDIYGKCGQMKCEPKFDRNCYKRIAANYKFYLSFENSFCKDYVTEKLFRILKYDIIPVVYGSANYEQIMPKNSYIDANKFKSPQHLAKFLRKLAKNEFKYNSYFKWKSNYCSEETPFNDPPKYFCNLCEKLNTAYNDKHVVYEVKNNLINWLYNEAECKVVE